LVSLRNEAALAAEDRSISSLGFCADLRTGHRAI
jgi:hypothetical protein